MTTVFSSRTGDPPVWGEHIHNPMSDAILSPSMTLVSALCRRAESRSDSGMDGIENSAAAARFTPEELASHLSNGPDGHRI